MHHNSIFHSSGSLLSRLQFTPHSSRHSTASNPCTRTSSSHYLLHTSCFVVPACSPFLHLPLVLASICASLDCRVPPHVHFTNNQCQCVFVIHDALSTSLNNILHFTLNALSLAIFDTDRPDTHLYIFFSIFTYSSRLITAEVDSSSYLLTCPRLPTGLPHTDPSAYNRCDMLDFFRQLQAQIPEHVLEDSCYCGSLLPCSGA